MKPYTAQDIDNWTISEDGELELWSADQDRLNDEPLDTIDINFLIRMWIDLHVQQGLMLDNEHQEDTPH